MKDNNKYIGGSFDEFLEDEGLLIHAESVALKRVLVWQILKEMKKKKMTKAKMAKKMRTSRAAVDRLLDPERGSLTLKSLEKVAHTLDKEVRITLV